MTEEYKVEPHHIFGLRQEVRNNLLFLDDQTIIFPSGNHCVRYHILQRWNKFIPAAKGSKGIQALAISPNRRYLAVSERRERGTITIYDLQNRQCRKRRVLTGGGIGVQEFVCMAFSSDSKYLLGQSGGPEWTLFYWEWEKNQVIAMEKTTRIDRVSQVSFNPKDNTQICVTGKGVFKIFKLENETLNRTTLFKMDVENILCHAWMSEDCIVAGTETGRLLLLMLKSGDMHRLGMPCERQTEERDSDVITSSPTELPRVTAITRYSTGFACSAGPGLICLYEETKEKDSYRKTAEIRIPQDPFRQSSQAERQEITSVCMSPSEETLAISTDQGQIYHINLAVSEISKSKQANFEFLFHSLHSGSITGLSVCSSKPLIATCSKDNSMRIWNYKTSSLELYKEFPEEPYCVSLHPNGLSILVGFFNKLCLMNLLVDAFRTVQEFAIGTCNVCAFNHDGNMFAAVSSNVIHIYNIRTHKKVDLKGHLKKVLSVKWSEDDRRLVSCGMDGAVYVWNVLTSAREADNVQRSCIYTDATFSPSTGTILAILRELVSDGVAYTAISMTCSGQAVFIGTSAGTVRVMEYPLLKGKLWTEYQAHSGPITKMVITPGDHYLLTASDDGSLLIWTITDHLGCKLCMGKEIEYTEEVLCAKTYLEKKDQILQEANNQMKWLKMEQENKLNQKEMNYNKKIDDLMQNYLQQIEDLKGQNQMVITPGDHYLLTASEDGSLLIWTITDHLGCKLCMGKEIEYTEEVLCAKTYLEKKDQILQEANNQMKWLKMEQENKLNQKEMNYNKKIDDLMQNYLQQIEDLKGQNQVLSTEKEGLKVFHQKTLAEIMKKHAKELEDEKQGHVETLTVEYEKHYELEQRMKAMQKDCEEKLHQQEESHLHAMEEMKQSYEAKLQEQQAKVQQGKKKSGETQRKRMKENVECELDDLCLKYEEDLQEVEEINSNLKYEMDLVEKQLLQFSKLKKELRDRDLSIRKLKEDLKNMQDQHKDAVNKIKELTKEKEEQKKTTCIQKTQISALLKKLERFNKGYEYDCVALQSQLKQLRQERDKLKKIVQQKEIKQLQKRIEENKTIIKELETEVVRNNRKNKEIVEDLKKRLTVKDQELCNERNRVRKEKTLVERMKADIQKGSNFLRQPKMLNDYFMKLHKCYIQKADATHGIDAEIMLEHTRQKGYVQKRLNVQKKQHAMEINNQQAVCTKIMKASTMMAKELSQERTKNYKMQMILDKKNTPTGECK
ncbi:hypothetical protein PDJAM_G00194050 [Pangasius djambal]|uniref:Uncharacterized protein n=1 Tax=Pangasius djambal TaxID=1691987 RepID=A0ACC5ZQ32_9TELE|nr:hypothetical protein [Pangasius djambal]